LVGQPQFSYGFGQISTTFPDPRSFPAFGTEQGGTPGGFTATYAPGWMGGYYMIRFSNVSGFSVGEVQEHWNYPPGVVPPSLTDAEFSSQVGAYGYIPPFGTSPIPEPSILRSLNPSFIPILGFAPEPAPIPYWLVPYRVETPDLPYEYPHYSTDGDIRSVVSPGLKPYQVPSIDWVFSNRQDRVGQGVHDLRPAFKGEKERKIETPLFLPITLFCTML